MVTAGKIILTATQSSLLSFLSLSGLPCSYLPASTYFQKRKRANKETAPIFHEHFRIISQGCLPLRIQSAAAAASSAAALHHSVLHLSAYVLIFSPTLPWYTSTSSFSFALIAHTPHKTEPDCFPFSPSL